MNDTLAAVMPETFGKEDDKISTWNFEGKEYPLFVVDSTDVTAVQIKRKETDEDPIGVLSARFNWQGLKSEPFVNRVDIDFVEKIDIKENTIERENRHTSKRNADFFDSIVEGGEFVKIEDGEHLPPQTLTREQMLKRTEELKNNIVNKWLYVGFTIERYFERGMDEFDALTAGETDSIKFLLKIGSPREPSNVLLLDFAPPSQDARRAYSEKRTSSKSKLDGGIEKSTTLVDWEAKIRYAKKYLRGVSGAGVQTGEGSGVLPVVSDADLTAFKLNFNPDWLMRLGDALQDSFNIGGK